MDEATRKNRFTGYNVKCGDNTSGSISAKDPDHAREMAEEMCRVHQGVQSGPEAAPGAPANR